ncbi:hypothetical protein [Streptomyces olivoreticuli]|uniref:hypothetical protein n=1 Tax=Streptomyces olivoreticuli TaxID=68246 RepID=UPI000E25401E|nr:hypothetical protein [Streptomyces olivoreticuli]
MSTHTVSPHTGHGTEAADDVFAPLHGQVADAELEALRTAPVLTPIQRAALTLVSLGHTHRGAATLLGGPLHAVNNALDHADQKLESGGRTPALLHAAYRNPGYPLPLPQGTEAEQPPVLDGEERAVLDAHATGITLIQLVWSRNCRTRHLTAANKRLLAKLAAHHAVHCVRRAWELGIYTRQNCPAVPEDSPDGTSRPGPDNDGTKISCPSANPGGSPAGIDGGRAAR